MHTVSFLCLAAWSSAGHCHPCENQALLQFPHLQASFAEADLMPVEIGVAFEPIASEQRSLKKSFSRASKLSQ